ncbi:MAG TPA: dihydrofolate reductase family protein [Ktedonobacterales bacterium]
MRKLWLLMNVSLDGYFEGPGHDISWTSSDYEAFSPEGSNEVDALLFGRRTYELMKLFWPTPQAEERVPEVARFMNERRKYVVSHQPFEPGWSNVTVVSEDVLATIRRLKEQPGGSIAIFGSNNLCVSLMDAGLIDEFQIIVNPVALGEGTSMFKGLPAKAELTLAASQQFKSGGVMLTYTPKR